MGLDLTHEIKVLLVGNATGLDAVLKGTSGEAEALGVQTSTSTGLLGKLGLQGKSTGELIGTGLKVGAAAATVAIGAMAVKGVSTFSDMTSTVRGFQRVLGGTAEDSSKLAAATARMGIDAQTAQTAFGQLAKRIGEGKDTLAQWGVEVAHNKDGSTNFATTLENISDKYASIQDPAERAAFASENFGKGFMSINALLGQGRENLQAFYDVAAQNHQIFSQDQLTQGLMLSRSMKDLSSAFQGIELEIGQAVVPAVKTLADGLTLAVHGLDSLGAGLSSAALLAGGATIGFNKLFSGIEGLGGGEAILAGVTFGVLAQGIEDFANRTLHAEDVISTFGPALAKMDAQKAASEWQSAVSKMRDADGIIDGVSNKMKLFKELADSDPIGAQKIVTGMQQRGESTTAYTKILDGAIKKQAEASAANDAATQTIDASTGAIKAQTAATKEDTKAHDDLVKAVQDATQVVADAADKDLGLLDARNSMVKTLGDYTTAQKDANDAGGQSAEKNQALTDATLTAEHAILSTAGAARDAAKAHAEQSIAIDDVDRATKIADAGNAAYRQELDGLRQGLDPESPLRKNIDGIIGQLDATAQARKVQLDISEVVDGVQKVHDLLNSLPEQVRVQVGIDAMNAGIYGPGSLQISDRELKTDFGFANRSEILEGIAALPLMTWVYKAEPGVRHIGPMAQDFARFGFGPDDRTIATVDAVGVLIAGIQALYRRVVELEGPHGAR